MSITHFLFRLIGGVCGYGTRKQRLSTTHVLNEMKAHMDGLDIQLDMRHKMPKRRKIGLASRNAPMVYAQKYQSG